MKKRAAALLAGVMMLSIPLGVSAAEKKAAPKSIDYVALGDSLAAGQTPYKTLDTGYTDFIVKHLRNADYKVDYRNFGVSGYTSIHLMGDVLMNETVRNEIREASHVTIDIGANDLLYKLKTDPANAAQAVVTVSNNLQTILSEIDRLNSDVDVFVMGYYNAFPYYPQAEQARLMPLLEGLNNQIELRAKMNGDSYVPTFDKIGRNYPAYLPNPMDIHLSKEGYKVIANQFFSQIKIQLILDVINRR
ncbi:SGNH/GDSL hydrolase family protein [Fictibacillus aquaticus]|uniref:SGNH hydrolase-type esterase domain-containing protein n=1 Tax=Fictibacillus aquaticus TaxID=2021314 RepID=A0A235F864_9BACL|nr:GDSL-type esterase/lipase family protein [Fictibacillus aquaticus]OYD57541.1 hypothetical protein CGZ90_12790 [Fictibacillus aquaticus]